MSSSITGATLRPAPPRRPFGLQLPRDFNETLRLFDIVMLAAWVISTTMPFGWAQPLRYFGAAYFAGCMILRARETMPAALRAWPTFLLPVLCIISALWAPYASDAIRKGVLLALTGIAAIYVASRISGRQILTIMVLVEGMAALMSVAQPNEVGGAWTGIFGQKNFLSGNIIILHVCALGVVFDKGSQAWIRLVSLALIPVAMLLIIKAQSATIVALMAASLVAMTAHALFWAPAKRVKHLRTLVVLAGASIALATMLVVFNTMHVDGKKAFLEAFGKDSTLTGRTYLWSIAERIMHEKPWTGTGADGFWRAEYGEANAITRFFYFEKFTGFSFHNSYLENGATLGYPGYWATIIIAVWGLWRTGMNWLLNQNAVNAAFLVLTAIIVVRSNAEIDLAQEFMATAFFLFIGATRKEVLPSTQATRSFRPHALFRRAVS